jgi:hypothetical protein
MHPRIEGPAECEINQAISVRFDIRRDLPETRNTSLNLFTNDPDRPMHSVQVQWKCVSELTADPDRLDFGTVDPEHGASREFRLSARFGREFELIDVTAAPSDEINLVGPAGGSETIRIAGEPIPFAVSIPPRELDIVNATDGPRLGTITVLAREIDSGAEKIVSIPVTWRPASELMVTPTMIHVGRKPAGEKVTRSIVLRGARDRLEVDAAELDGVERDAVELDAVELDAAERVESVRTTRVTDRVVKIDVTFEVPESDGPFNARLRIACRSPQRRELVVPISGWSVTPDGTGGNSPPGHHGELAETLD